MLNTKQNVNMIYSFQNIFLGLYTNEYLVQIHSYSNNFVYLGANLHYTFDYPPFNFNKQERKRVYTGCIFNIKGTKA